MIIPWLVYVFDPCKNAFQKKSLWFLTKVWRNMLGVQGRREFNAMEQQSPGLYFGVGLVPTPDAPCYIYRYIVIYLYECLRFMVNVGTYIIHTENGWNDISRNNKLLIVKPKKHTFISALSQNLCTYHYLSTDFKHCTCFILIMSVPVSQTMF